MCAHLQGPTVCASGGRGVSCGNTGKRSMLAQQAQEAARQEYRNHQECAAAQALRGQHGSEGNANKTQRLMIDKIVATQLITELACAGKEISRLLASITVDCASASIAVQNFKKGEKHPKIMKRPMLLRKNNTTVGGTQRGHPSARSHKQGYNRERAR